MYKQLDLFGNVPEEQSVPLADPVVSTEDKSSMPAVAPQPITESEKKPLIAVMFPPEHRETQKRSPVSTPDAEKPEDSEIPQVNEPLGVVEDKPIMAAISTGQTEDKGGANNTTFRFLDTIEEPADEIIIVEPQPEIIAIAPKKGKRGRKSQKEMEAEAAAIEIPPDDILFKKQYYGIGEVSRMFKLNSSLLRYWESEFDIIKPRKNRKGDRHFRPEDIKNLYLIHHLLRARKYTIEGAKTYLKKNKNKAAEQFEIIQKLEKVKQFLLELKAGL